MSPTLKGTSLSSTGTCGAADLGLLVAALEGLLLLCSSTSSVTALVPSARLAAAEVDLLVEALVPLVLRSSSWSVTGLLVSTRPAADVDLLDETLDPLFLRSPSSLVTGLLVSGRLVACACKPCSCWVRVLWAWLQRHNKRAISFCGSVRLLDAQDTARDCRWLSVHLNIRHKMPPLLFQDIYKLPVVTRKAKNVPSHKLTFPAAYAYNWAAQAGHGSMLRQAQCMHLDFDNTA